MSTEASCPICLSSGETLLEQAAYPFFIGLGDLPPSEARYPMHLLLCRACRFAYQAQDDNRIKKLNDFYCDGQGNSSFAPNESDFSQAVADLCLRMMQPWFRPGQSVLEIGCGDGYLLDQLERTIPSLKTTGIEPSRKAGISDGISGRVIRATFPCPELKTKRFDRIYSKALLEHVFDFQAFFGAVGQALAPGGKLISIVPNQASVIESGNLGMVIPEHISYFTPESLLRLHERNNFEVEMLQVTPAIVLCVAAPFPAKKSFSGFQARIVEFQQLLDTGNCSFYGASSELFNLLSLCHASGAVRIYDSDPNKAGKLLVPGQPPVQGPSSIPHGDRVAVIPFNHRRVIEDWLTENRPDVQIIRFWDDEGGQA